MWLLLIYILIKPKLLLCIYEGFVIKGKVLLTSIWKWNYDFKILKWQNLVVTEFTDIHV